MDAVAEVAAARGVPSAEVALAWLLAKPGMTAPIVGATKKRHLKDALAAEEFTLSEDEIARSREAYVPHPVLGHCRTLAPPSAPPFSVPLSPLFF